MTNITNTVSYVRFTDFAKARGLRATASFLLVRTGDADEVTGRIETATGLTALTKDQFSTQERQIVQDMAADLMRIMTVAAFLIGLAVVGLVLYSATLSRLREVGVMKALGSTNKATAGVVLAQAAYFSIRSLVGPAMAPAGAFAAWLLGHGVVAWAMRSQPLLSIRLNVAFPLWVGTAAGVALAAGATGLGRLIDLSAMAAQGWVVVAGGVILAGAVAIAARRLLSLRAL